MKENLEVSIFDLCKRKKEIEFKEGNKVWKGYIVKPNIEERNNITNFLPKQIDKIKSQVKEAYHKGLQESYENLTKEQLIEQILIYENSSFTAQLADFYIDEFDEDGNPLPDEDKKKRKEDKRLELKNKKQAELTEKQKADIVSELINLSISALSLSQAIDEMDKIKILYMIRDRKEKRIFNSIEDIDKLFGDIGDIYPFLIDQINKFEIIKDEKQAEGVADAESFRNDIQDSPGVQTTDSTEG